MRKLIESLKVLIVLTLCLAYMAVTGCHTDVPQVEQPDAKPKVPVTTIRVYGYTGYQGVADSWTTTNQVTCNGGYCYWTDDQGKSMHVSGTFSITRE